MSEKMKQPEIKIEVLQNQVSKKIKTKGLGLLLGNPAGTIGECELIYYNEFPGRVFLYQSETETTRTMDIDKIQVVEVINHYKNRNGEKQRRMYYKVSDQKIVMIMRIFEWDNGEIKVQTNKKELVRPYNRMLETGTFKNKVVDIVDLTIGKDFFPNSFRVRESELDFHGKAYSESYFSVEGRQILEQTYVGDNWKMGGYVSWDKLEKSLEREFQGEKYRQWSEIILLKSYQIKKTD